MGVALGSLVLLPARAHAQRTATQIIGLYMTTDEAYNAYGSANTSPAPPQVRAFPTGVSYVGVYIHYRGARPHKTSYRVGFRHGSAEVRHGSLHTFDYADGAAVLGIPADEMQALGPYKATLYVDGVPAMSVAFSVIRTPTIDTAYMITGKAWDAFDPNGTAVPPKTTAFPANVARVGAYYSYSGMHRADVHYVAVYNAVGKLVHRSHDNTTSFVPEGAFAIILPADDGSYPRGTYRTDLYIDGAMVKSLAWSAR
jgi:hypothetical protein